MWIILNMIFRKFSDWLGLNKLNKSRVIIALTIILLNFAAFVYVFSWAICMAPTCFEGNVLYKLLLPIVEFTYYPFYAQNELADSIVYERRYLNETTHVIEIKYPAAIEYAIRALFVLLALSIYLMGAYILSGVIYTVYKRSWNK